MVGTSIVLLPRDLTAAQSRAVGLTIKITDHELIHANDDVVIAKCIEATKRAQPGP